MPEQQSHKPGDVVNGHVLTANEGWRPVKGQAPTSTHADPVATGEPDDPGEGTARKSRRWLVPTIAGVLGLLLGVAIGAAGAGSDTQAKDDLAAAQALVTKLEGQIRASEESDASAQAAYQKALNDVTAREDAVAVKEGELQAREQAVTATEQQVAKNSIGDGVWVVGTDVEPGTYRSEAVASDCYWAILKSGTNGADIIQNDLPGGGNPTVTLSPGQDFSTQGCETWTKTG